jgi:hypothetical protein
MFTSVPLSVRACSGQCRPSPEPAATLAMLFAIVVKWFFRLAFFLPCILPSAVIALI